MDRRRRNALIGLAMVALGLVQAGSYVVRSDWVFSFFGVLYALIGGAYLWAEVYAPAR